LYALGATLLHLLSRKPPDELLRAGMELAFEGEVNVSDGLRGWLKRLVERDRTARFQSAKAALEALDALDRPVRPKGQPARAPTEGLVSRGWVLAGGLIVAMGAIGVLAVGTRSDPPLPPRPPPITKVVPQPPPAQKVTRAPAAPAAPAMSHAEVVTVPKLKPLPPFTLDTGFTAPLNAELKLPEQDAAGAACEPSPSSLSLTQLKAVPGSPAALVLETALASHGGPPGCANVYVELLDQHGQRATATLVSNPTPGTTKKADVRLALPDNSQRVQLRVGPQAAPYAVYDVDLAAQRVVKK
jgi:hypothetical protein